MKYVRILSTAAILGLMQNPLAAADYMRPSLPYDSGSQGGYNWEGVYVGVFGGMGRGTSTATEARMFDDDRTMCAPDGTAGVPSGMYFCNLNGAPNYTFRPTASFNLVGDTWGMPLRGTLAGVTAGINKQLGSMVYGVEADVGYMNLSGTSGPSPASRDDTTLHTAASDFMTARMRVGYAMDRFMVFGTAGGALGRFNSWVDDPDIPVGISTAPTATQAGFVLGAGVEYALTDNISLKADYMHMQFFPTRSDGYVNVSCVPSACPPDWKIDRAGAALEGIAGWEIKHKVDMARLGINVKF
jgi:opacity protein-like surface antigen